MALIGKKLDEGKDVLILVRDTPVSDREPYTVDQRINMIKRAYGDLYGDRVTAIGFPDFEGVAYGRGVGWQIEEIDVGEEIKKISATSIRKRECDAMAESVKAFVDNQQTTFWFTGLPCSGKTTICDSLKYKLAELGYNVTTLDGDDVRTGLCKDLGFTPEDRSENLRRISHVCNMHNKNNTIVLASFVSPTEELRDIPKSIIDNIKIIHVNTPLEVCEERDTKGMYKLAREGTIPNFTGISAPFEDAKDPALVIDASNEVEKAIDIILDHFKF
jgi:adenylyl-sulfate kinase